MASALKQLMEMMLRNSTRVLVEAVEDRKRQQNGVTTVKIIFEDLILSDTTSDESRRGENCCNS